MPTDITRRTFDPSKHYSSVRKQQGRVDIDADLNELNDVRLHLERTANRDIIGRAGGPDGNAGFEISGQGTTGIKIKPGRYYVDGILVELEGDPTVPIAYTAQPDFPGAPTNWLDTAGNALPGRYHFYLDVWEREITALEDPHIREVALGGPDHGTRTKVIAQVRAKGGPADKVCGDFHEDWANNMTPGDNKLTARTAPDEQSPDPCEVAASAGYRGLENQLYRVEVREKGATGAAKFAWSRENASVQARVENISGNTITISGYIRDEKLGFTTGSWIELIDDERELRGERGVFAKVTEVGDNTLTVDQTTIDPGAANMASSGAFTTNAKVRRWDSPGLVTVTTPAGDGYLALEDGIEVRFDVGSELRVGDFWQIPARVNARPGSSARAGTIEWPVENPAADPLVFVPLPPMGIHHHYARLAIADLDAIGTWTMIDDCRCIFHPLCDLPTGEDCCCCTITVSADREKSEKADHYDLETALDDLTDVQKSKLVHICLLPGIHQLTATVNIVPGLNLIISGCKGRTFVNAPVGLPAFVATDAQVEFRDFDVLADAIPPGIDTSKNPILQITMPATVQMIGCHDSALKNMYVRNGIGADQKYWFMLDGLDSAALMEPDGIWREALAINRPADRPALLVEQGARIRIEGSRFFGLPAIRFGSDIGEILGNGLSFGGLEITGGTSMLSVRDNRIHTGYGNGITLGTSIELPPSEDPLVNYALVARYKGEAVVIGLNDIGIEGNHILLMEDNGIASDGTRAVNGIGSLAQNIRIERNEIRACARRSRIQRRDETFGGVVLTGCDDLRIVDNVIIQNGGAGKVTSGILLEDCGSVSVLSNTIEDNGSAQEEMGSVIDLRAFKAEDGLTEISSNGVTIKYASNNYLQQGSALMDLWSGVALTEAISIEFAPPVNDVQLLICGEDVLITSDDGPIELTSKSAEEAWGRYVPRLADVRGEVPIAALKIRLMDGSTGSAQLLKVSTGSLNGIQAGIAALHTRGGGFRTVHKQAAKRKSPFEGRSLSVHDNIVNCPAGQALLVHGTGDISAQDNKLYSTGEYMQPLNGIGAPDQDPSDFFAGLVQQLGRVISVANMGLPFDADGLLKLDPRANLHKAGSSKLRQVPNSLGLGGRVLCSDNQVDLLTRNSLFGAIGLPSVFAISLDDIGLQQNQIRSIMVNTTQIVDVLVLAFSARVQENRVQDLGRPASHKSYPYETLSIFTAGLMANMSDNMTTHCAICLPTPWSVDRNNVVLSQPMGPFALPGEQCPYDPPGNRTPCEDLKAKLCSATMPAMGDDTAPDKDPGKHKTFLAALKYVSDYSEHAARSSARRSEKERVRGERLQKLLYKHFPDRKDLIKRSGDRNQAIGLVETGLRDRAKRAKQMLSGGPNDWSLTGNVVYDDGTPAAGLIVTVVTSEKSDKLPRMSARVNDFGDFQLLVDTCANKEFVEAFSHAALSLTVTSPDGKEIDTYATAIRCVAGRSDHVSVGLDVVRGSPGTGREDEGPHMKGPGDPPARATGKNGRKKAK